jgi:deoxycytidylate deaminase
MLSPKEQLRTSQIATLIASESYCVNLQVGALLLNSKSYIVGEGRNGTLPGFPNVCEDSHGKTLPIVIHAEMNAILHYTGIEKDLILMTTHSPCTNCAKHIAGSGIIKGVYYIHKYEKDYDIPLEIFSGGNIIYEQLAF